MQNYSLEKTVDGIEISRNLIFDEINVQPGLCRADKNIPYQSRDIQFYDRNILNQLIVDGKISDGSKSPFDDRKMRYDKADLDSDRQKTKKLIIYLGHSHFLDYREKGKRTEEETRQLTKLGIQHFQDPYAFFGRNPGVTSIIKSSDKKIIVGQRNVKTDMQLYAGLLQGAAGHILFKEDPMKISIESEAYREISEETGIQKKDISRLEFLGLFSFPEVAGDDLDFCYLAHTHIDSQYFTSSNWKKNVQKPEHKEFFAIKNFDELQELVNRGVYNNAQYDLVFSTRGPLAEIKPQDFE